MSDTKRGSIELARRLCYEIAGPTDEDDDMTGSGYGSVDIAEILSGAMAALREENERLRADAERFCALVERIPYTLAGVVKMKNIVTADREALRKDVREFIDAALAQGEKG